MLPLLQKFPTGTILPLKFRMQIYLEAPVKDVENLQKDRSLLAVPMSAPSSSYLLKFGLINTFAGWKYTLKKVKHFILHFFSSEYA